MIQYIHVQLSAWGRWVIRSEARAVGYSPVSPMFKDASHGGAYGSSVPLGVSTDSASDLVDLDAAISRLTNEQRQLVAQYYVVQGKGEDVAARLGIAKRTLYDRLHAVQQAVLGHLQDICAGGS